MNAKLALRSSCQGLRQGHAAAHSPVPGRPLAQRLRRSDRGSLQIVAVKTESQGLQTGFRAPDFVVGAFRFVTVGGLRNECSTPTNRCAPVPAAA